MVSLEARAVPAVPRPSRLAPAVPRRVAGPAPAALAARRGRVRARRRIAAGSAPDWGAVALGVGSAAIRLAWRPA